MRPEGFEREFPPCSDGIWRAYQTEIDLADTGAVAVFEAGNLGKGCIDAVVEIAFTDASEFQLGHASDIGDTGEGTEARRDLVVEHRVKLTRRAGKEENGAVRATVDARWQIEAGGSAVGIWQDIGSGGNHRLAEISGNHRLAAQSEKVFQNTQCLLILMKFEAESFRHDLTGEVIAGGAEAAGDEKDIRADDHFRERLADRFAIGDSDLPCNAQTHGEELPPEPTAVRVERVTEE